MYLSRSCLILWSYLSRSCLILWSVFWWSMPKWPWVWEKHYMTKTASSHLLSSSLFLCFSTFSCLLSCSSSSAALFLYLSSSSPSDLMADIIDFLYEKTLPKLEESLKACKDAEESSEPRETYKLSEIFPDLWNTPTSPLLITRGVWNPPLLITKGVWNPRRDRSLLQAFRDLPQTLTMPPTPSPTRQESCVPLTSCQRSSLVSENPKPWPHLPNLLARGRVRSLKMCLLRHFFSKEVQIIYFQECKWLDWIWLCICMS